ncbi:hypothetical protein PVL29_005241 [Vitis rotundifolia]|uniref:Uncharacterized protein n=1 Tax=Vitis rotundifolia TaxID=103349 RepID=A0AA39AAE1_VITRO|nr:hypothetical protein PVL29_005241 [Vitis rotundifolia]
MDRRSSSWPLGLLTLILAPVAAAMLLYQLDPYDPAPVPIHEFSQQPMVVPKLNSRMLQGSEMIGVGKLLGPEDIAYHPDSHLIYTGCADGWVRRVTLNDSGVQNWAFTGGRPLGVALGRHGQLIIADAEMPCLKYHIQGERKGSMDKFIDNLSGIPDNIQYDGNSLAWDLALKYPWIQKVVAIMERYKVWPHMEKNGGVLVVELEVNPIAYYYDLDLLEVTSGVKIGNHLYCGSITAPYLIRLVLHQHAAHATL